MAEGLGNLVRHTVISSVNLNTSSFVDNHFTSMKDRRFPEYSGLTRDLPMNIHLLTLEKVASDSVILRLEHFYEKDEDPILSKPGFRLILLGLLEC